jgi:hypothetical protein
MITAPSVTSGIVVVVVGGIVVVDVVVVLDVLVVGVIVVVVVLVVGGTVDVVVVVVVAAFGGPNVQPASPGHSAIRARVALRHRVDIGPTVPPLPAK